MVAEIYLDRVTSLDPMRTKDLEVPVTASNFLDLAKARFFHGLHFHRVINDFMIQSGSTACILSH